MSRTPNCSATRFSWFALVYAAYHRSAPNGVPITHSLASGTGTISADACTELTSDLTAPLVFITDPLRKLRPVTYRALCDLTLVLSLTYIENPLAIPKSLD